MDKLYKCFLIFFGFTIASCGGGGGSSSGDDSGPTPLVTSPTSVENSTVDVETVQIDGNSTGTVVAVWTQASALIARELWASIYSPGTGWSTPVRINPETILNSFDVVIAENGNATAVWGTATNGIWYSHYAGSSWTTAAQVSTNGIEPYLTKDRSGSSSALLAWTDNLRETMLLSKYTTAWSAEEVVPTQLNGEITTPNIYNPTAGIDSSGNIHAIWWSAGAFRVNLQQSSIWAVDAEELAATVTRKGSLAVSPSGYGMFSWAQTSGVDTYIYSTTYESGTWTVAGPRSQYAGILLNRIQSVVAANGDGRICWDAVTVSSASQNCLGYSSTAGWDANSAPVPGANLPSSHASHVVSSSNDATFTAWSNSGGTFINIYGLIKWNDPILVTDDVATTPYLHATNNRIVLVWINKSGATKNLWSASWTL